jgi:cytochrome c oxidase assembly protein subunit 11
MMSAEPKPSKGVDDNKKVITRLMFIVIGMFGFGFALVPIYDVFCDITGLNGKTGEQIAAPLNLEIDTSRVVTVEFVASLNETMPWEFQPEVKSVKVNPGQPTKISYYARNKTDSEIIGQAVPSVAPGLAAPYFQKTECFCFTEQTLEAGEEKHMPVIFIVDPELPDNVDVLTLSYTFFIKPGSKAAPMALNKEPKNSKHQEL